MSPRSRTCAAQRATWCCPPCSLGPFSHGACSSCSPASCPNDTPYLVCICMYACVGTCWPALPPHVDVAAYVHPPTHAHEHTCAHLHTHAYTYRSTMWRTRWVRKRAARCTKPRWTSPPSARWCRRCTSRAGARPTPSRPSARSSSCTARRGSAWFPTCSTATSGTTCSLPPRCSDVATDARVLRRRVGSLALIAMSRALCASDMRSGACARLRARACMLIFSQALLLLVLERTLLTGHSW